VKHVPKEDGSAPIAMWKRLEIMHDALPPRDRVAVKQGGFVGLGEANAKTAAGEG
jgi:urocanate hydratase